MPAAITAGDNPATLIIDAGFMRGNWHVLMPMTVPWWPSVMPTAAGLAECGSAGEPIARPGSRDCTRGGCHGVCGDRIASSRLRGRPSGGGCGSVGLGVAVAGGGGGDVSMAEDFAGAECGPGEYGGDACEPPGAWIVSPHAAAADAAVYVVGGGGWMGWPLGGRPGGSGGGAPPSSAGGGGPGGSAGALLTALGAVGRPEPRLWAGEAPYEAAACSSIASCGCFASAGTGSGGCASGLPPTKVAAIVVGDRDRSSAGSPW